MSSLNKANTRSTKTQLIRVATLLGAIVIGSMLNLSSALAFEANQSGLNPTQLQAKALSEEGKHKESLALLKSAPKNQATYSLMISNLASIDLDDAEEVADEAVKTFPESAELHYMRGVIMGNQAQESSIFSALGYAENSLNSFVRATELAPNTIKYRRALMSFYLAAPSIAGGDEELALAQLNAIKKIDAFEGAAAQVAFYQMSEEPKEAISTLEQAIIDFPNETNFVFSLAALYAQAEDYEKALPLFQKAAEMPVPDHSVDPLTGEAAREYVRNMSAKLNSIYQIGRTAVVTGKNTEIGIAAMGKLQAAVETSRLNQGNLPNMEWAKARLAELYLQAGDKKAAADLLAKITVEDNKDLQKQVKKLKKMI